MGDSKMAFQNALYPDFFNELLNFKLDNDFNRTCNVILSKNQTLIEIDRGWEGIPETLVINLVFCFILISFFLCIRFASSRQDSTKNTWLQFIYGDRVNLVNLTENRKQLTITRDENLKNNLVKLMPFHITKCKVNKNNAISPSTSSDSSPKFVNFTEESSSQLPKEDAIVIQPNRGSSDNLVQSETTFPANADFNSASIRFQFFRSDSIYRMNSWLSSLFRLTEIYEKKGPDAYQYLLFQQYIIVLLSLITFVCIVILLPINIQGDNEGKAFARTTLSHIPPDSALFWVHAISATITVIMGVYFMHYFSKVLKTDDDLMSRTTLLIRQLPPVKENEDSKSTYSSNFLKSLLLAFSRFSITINWNYMSRIMSMI
ncbi:Transmembrane protein 63C [Tyrophagus putrescentiae]|nr:Transmembrane protein 63C [Tyrophagus putrescentiae]